MHRRKHENLAPAVKQIDSRPELADEINADGCANR
jgi:hypothetical protein